MLAGFRNKSGAITSLIKERAAPRRAASGQAPRCVGKCKGLATFRKSSQGGVAELNPRLRKQACKQVGLPTSLNNYERHPYVSKSYPMRLARSTTSVVLFVLPACEVALWQQLGTDELNAPLDRCSQVRAGLQRG